MDLANSTSHVSWITLNSFCVQIADATANFAKRYLLQVVCFGMMFAIMPLLFACVRHEKLERVTIYKRDKGVTGFSRTSDMM